MTECSTCKGKQRIPTDLWNIDTAAMWEPCPFCCEPEAIAFYSVVTTEDQRQAWYK